MFSKNTTSSDLNSDAKVAYFIFVHRLIYLMKKKNCIKSHYRAKAKIQFFNVISSADSISQRIHSRNELDALCSLGKYSLELSVWYPSC